jgi:hypothetical protein
MTVTEYRDRFLQLARYAPAEVAHDGDKQERFREGLDDHLEYALMNHRFDNFNQLVDAALNTERKRREIEDKKRKMAPTTTGSNTRPRYQYPQQQQQHQRQIQQYQVTWRTTSADSTISRRCLPADVPVAPYSSCIYFTLPHSLN